MTVSKPNHQKIMRVGDKIAPLHHPIFKPANLPDFLAVARITAQSRRAPSESLTFSRLLELQRGDIAQQPAASRCAKERNRPHYPPDQLRADRQIAALASGPPPTPKATALHPRR